MKIILSILKLINIINLLSMLMFIPGLYERLLLIISDTILTDNILVNQIVVALIANILIGLYAEMHKVQRPDTGSAIIKESTKTAKILTGISFIICISACIIFHLEPFQYLLVCMLQSLGVLNSSRTIAKLRNKIKR